MLNSNGRKTGGKWQFGPLLALSLLAAGGAARADTPMTAGVIMEKMNGEQRYAYVAGVVEGLAYARFQKDGKKEDGLSCIYAWFYERPTEEILTIYDAFQKYPDYPPGVIVWTLVKKQCGE